MGDASMNLLRCIALATALVLSLGLRNGSIAHAVCGDGTLDGGELCDDGNTNDGDCCSSSCQFEPLASPCDLHASQRVRWCGKLFFSTVVLCRRDVLRRSLWRSDGLQTRRNSV